VGAPPKVELRNVDLSYFALTGETEALRDISLSVSPGEFVAIIGQSGCGKSTLLSLISGILQPTDGAVLIDGKPVTGPSRKAGYMLQQDYLFEWRTILANAVLSAEPGRRHAPRAGGDPISPATPGQYLHHLPRQLSGACASASRLRARSQPSRTWYCWTSRSRRSVPDPARAGRRGGRDPSARRKMRSWSAISARRSAWRIGSW
jgi:NitT/TauT family transport system ATP-binding protein